MCVESELEFVLGGNGGDWGTIACFSSDIIRKTNPLFKDKHCCFFYIHIYIYKVFIKKHKAIIKKTLIIKLEDLHSHKMQVKKKKKMR